MRCRIIADPSCIHDFIEPSSPDSAFRPDLIVSLAISNASTFDSILSFVLFLANLSGISTALEESFIPKSSGLSS